MPKESGHPRPADGHPESLLHEWLRSFGLFRRVMEPFFAGFGITGAQWAVLNSLLRAEREGIHEVRMSDLGARLLIRPPSVTTVVQRSAEMGLLANKPLESDHRVKCVTLTERGRDMIGRVRTDHEKTIRGVFECLSHDEQQTLASLLGRVSAHLAGQLNGESSTVGLHDDSSQAAQSELRQET